MVELCKRGGRDKKLCKTIISSIFYNCNSNIIVFANISFTSFDEALVGSSDSNNYNFNFNCSSNFFEYKNDIKHVQKIQQLEEEVERARQEKERLENENEFYALTIEDNQKYFLIMLYRKLGLTESDRISLYYRNSIDKDFEIVARYSTSNRFKEHSRPSYPHDQGYISKCWETKDDDFYVEAIPEASYTENIDYFASEMNMAPETLRHLKMKSRAFYIKNVKDKNRDKSIGVIVIESINSKIANLNEKQLKSKLDSDMMEYLYQLMDNKLRGN